MNTTNTRRTATAIVSAAAAAGALTIISAVAPTAASASRIDPNLGSGLGSDLGSGTRCAVATVASGTASMEIDETVTMLKVRRARYLGDHPGLLR